MSDQVRPWDMLNPNEERVSNEEKDIRLEICKNCDKFFKPTRQCKKCGCFMDLKAQLKRAVCPLEKW